VLKGLAGPIDGPVPPTVGPVEPEAAAKDPRRLQTERLREIVDVLLLAFNQIRARFGVLARRESAPQRPHASADAFARLQEDDRGASRFECARRGETGETGAPNGNHTAVQIAPAHLSTGYTCAMLALLALTLVFIQPPQADLQARIRTLIADSGAEVAIAFQTLDGSRDLLIDPDKPFHAASTMKVPVMTELFREAAAGQLSLDEQLPIKNEFHSIVDGSVYRLDPGDDSDAVVYEAVGRTLSLRQLCEQMITVSSNFAANLLIERLGVENIRRTVTRLGADGMQVLRGVEDDKAFARGMNNTTTARGLMILMQKIATGHAVSPSADAEMAGILKRQHFNDGIPAGVPPGTVVGHKTGTITKIHNDAAIVYGPRPYVLVVLVRGIQDQKVSAALIASISREIWTAAEQ
jgi:beta-lactamase class A